MFEGMQCFTTGLETPAKPEVRAFQAIFAEFTKRRDGTDAIKHISESIRVIVRLDEGQNNQDEKPVVMREDNSRVVHFPTTSTTQRLSVGYLEGENGVVTPNAPEEEPPAKRSKTSDGSPEWISMSPLPSQAASRVSRSPSPKHSIQTAPRNEALAEDISRGPREGQIDANKIDESKGDSPGEETGMDAIWALACHTAAVGAQNDKNPLIDLSADDFEGVEVAETIKGLYHLVN